MLGNKLYSSLFQYFNVEFKNIHIVIRQLKYLDFFLFYLLILLDIFIQQCNFLRQAGHSEKATSLFQAMIDFTFFKPDSLQKLSTKQQV